MRIASADGTECQLTYCLNVHPGESLAAVQAALAGPAAAVRERVAHDGPFGVGLRIAAAAAAELEAPAARQALAEQLESLGMYTFTFNGFPYGTFHAAAVKEQVYAPDWRTPERLAYTMRLADIMADLLPDGVDGSISTVPGSYGAWIDKAADADAMIAGLGHMADHLAALEAGTGRHIEVCLEPEPDCYLQTTAETVAFMERVYGGGAEERRRAHLGVCLDTCHVALQFEELTDAVRAYRAAGIPLSKIQVSAALHLQDGPDSRRALQPFDEPVYLHQVKVRSGGQVHGHPDLPAALATPFETNADWRVHFHVPLYFTGAPPLDTTGHELTADFYAEARRAGARHFEIETYTFDVLPEDLREPDIATSIAREYDAVLGRW